LGVRGRPPQPYTARLRAATTVAPTWYAAAVLALGAFAATTLVGAPAGAGVAALGVALCALAAAHTATAGTATAADTATAMDSATAPSRGAATSGGLRGGSLAGRGAVATGRVVVPHRTALWLLAASLAVMPAVRAAAWVWVPCLFGAVMLASLAAAGGRSGRQVVAGLTAAVRRPLLGTAAAVAPLGRAAGRADGARVRPALRGGLIAAALLAVFVPLFTAADAAFAELVDRALPSEIDVDAPIGRAFALAAVVALGGALALARARGAAAAGAPAAARLARTEWLLPLASLVALFAAFVAVQLAVLFGGHDHVLHTTGLSYADYAHQGYGQLMAAAMLTLAVIAGARRWARVGGRRDDVLLRALLAALCALCLVVLASALKRLGLYEEAYGATRLRLLADANIRWLGAVLGLVLVTLAVGRSGWLPRAIVLLSAVGAVAFAVSNPDGRIASQNVDRYLDGGRIDGYYLSRLSADAAVPLTRLRSPECVAHEIRRDLDQPDGILGANLARARARRALDGLPAPGRSCPGY
jgi:hypothetical protein